MISNGVTPQDGAGNKAGHTDCRHYDLCTRAGTLSCAKHWYKGGCRDYTGTIIVKGLLYTCTCGYSDTLHETDDGTIVCQTCGAISTHFISKED